MRDVRRLRVDFNNGPGDLVFAHPNGEYFTPGTTVAVHDLDTDAFGALVVDCTSTSLTLRVRFDKTLELFPATPASLEQGEAQHSHFRDGDGDGR